MDRTGGAMTTNERLMHTIYAAFNRRDVDGALRTFSEQVSWPKASEGGRAIGKEQIRAYWTRQWQEFDPHVEPREVADLGGGRVRVRVHQVVKSLAGEVLSDGEVWHTYRIAKELVDRMDVGEGDGSPDEEVAAAFSRREP